MDIEAIDLIKGLKGKVHGKSNMFVRQNRITKKMHSGTVLNPNKKPPSPAQTAHFSKFGGYGRQAAQWIREHKGTQAYEDMRREYKNQHTIGTFIAYVTTKMMNNEIIS